METILITGANRGLGLGFTRTYLERGARVHACARTPERADELRRLAEEHGDRLEIHELDVTDAGHIAELKRALEGEAIDILLLNAGIYPDKSLSFGQLDEDKWIAGFRTNTIAPAKLSEALLPNVERSDRKVIAVVTSLMGSIADNQAGSFYMYRSSKAAVNMVVKSMAIDLKPRGIACVVLHPGWVKTDMGGPNARIDIPESVGGMRDVLDRLTLEDSGRFLAYDGRECPW